MLPSPARPAFACGCRRHTQRRSVERLGCVACKRPIRHNPCSCIGTINRFLLRPPRRLFAAPGSLAKRTTGLFSGRLPAGRSTWSKKTCWGFALQRTEWPDCTGARRLSLCNELVRVYLATSSTICSSRRVARMAPGSVIRQRGPAVANLRPASGPSSIKASRPN